MIVFIACVFVSHPPSCVFLQLAVLELNAADGQGGATNSKQHVCVNERSALIDTYRSDKSLHR